MSEHPSHPHDGHHPTGEHGHDHPHPQPRDPIVPGGEHDHAEVFPPPRAPDDPGPEIRERLKPPLRAVYLPDGKGHGNLRPAKNPSPDGSFGYVERFVEVGGEGDHFSPGTLVLGIDSDECGCVGPETLRIFRWDETESAWETIARSRPGQTRDYVWARVTRPGLYGLIGFSRDPLVARTLAILRLMRGGSAGDPEIGKRLAGRICELLVCSAETRKALEDPRFARAFVEENLRLGLGGLWLPEDAASVHSPRNPCGICRVLAKSQVPARSGFEQPPEMAMLALVTASSAILGQWDVLPLIPPPEDVVLAVHAALLPTGRVLFFGGSENRKAQNLGDPPGIDNTRLWDPATGTIDTLSSPANYDLFCCGHTWLADGRLLAAGGTKSWRPTPSHPVHGSKWEGIRDASVFDPFSPPGTNPWTTVWRMNPERGRTLGGGAWYPTLVTLADGRVLTVAGHPEFTDTRQNNRTLEVFDPATDAWVDQGPGADLPIRNVSKLPLYPRLHLLPDGRVFCSTPLVGPSGGPGDVSWIWDPATKAWTSISSMPGGEFAGLDSSSVLLPLRPEENYRARVLLTNAPQPKIMDLSVGAPAWQPTAPRALSDPILGPPPRYHAMPVLLADGTVLVQGGHSDPAGWSPPVLAAETFDPLSDTWSISATAAVPRVYHSVALLLPDGRVWTAGSDYGMGNHEGRMELYSPPYLFLGPGPTIASAPAVVTLPDQFEIETPDAAGIERVALVWCGVATHAFNDQRWVGLSIESRTASRLTVASPPSAAIAPPGYYLLFLLNGNGVPSIGHFVRIQSSDDPTISFLRPSSGPASGGTAVEIRGLNFQTGASVTMGGAAASAVGFLDKTRITATAPALPPGTLNDVSVSNPGGASVTRPGAWLADFLDVPAAHPFQSFVASLVRAGISAGCGAGNFCPDDPVTRGQMAVFLLKGMHGPGWAPPPATGAVFGDVPAPSFAAAWIEALAAEGITAGCGGGNYCPNDPVTRGQMAVFLLTAMNGPGFAAPPPTGLFADVAPWSPLAPWVEQLAAEKITAGCGGGNFCPDDPVTRGQMAVFLVRAFHLP